MIKNVTCNILSIILHLICSMKHTIVILISHLAFYFNFFDLIFQHDISLYHSSITLNSSVAA